MTGDRRPYEVLTMGRCGVDIYPQQIGVGLEDVTSFGKYLGGSPTNVAVAAARFGRRSAVITRTGADPFGRFIRQALRGYGVADAFVTSVNHLPTPVTFCEIHPPDNFPLFFYRFPKAPDLELSPQQLDLEAIEQAAIMWATVTGLCQEPSRAATLTALRTRGRRAFTVLDLDYRDMFWADAAQATDAIRQALPHVTVAVGNLDEVEVAVGTRDPHQAAGRLREAGVELAIVKLGPRGVLAADDNGVVEVPPVPVRVVNGLGAGDAFGGALCHGLLSGWDTRTVIEFANTAGAIVAGRLACSDAMPTLDEVASYPAEVSDAL